MANQHATAALHRKLAELGREIHALEGQLAQKQADRATLASALAILDPESTVHLTLPKAPDPLGVDHGRFSRSVLDVLRRASGPMTAREIGAQLVTDRGLDAPDKDAAEHITQRVRNSLASMAHRLVREQRGVTALWSVPEAARGEA
jgi:hypothetical protein